MRGIDAVSGSQVALDGVRDEIDEGEVACLDGEMFAGFLDVVRGAARGDVEALIGQRVQDLKSLGMFLWRVNRINEEVCLWVSSKMVQCCVGNHLFSSVS